MSEAKELLKKVKKNEENVDTWEFSVKGLKDETAVVNFVEEAESTLSKLCKKHNVKYSGLDKQ